MNSNRLNKTTASYTIFTLLWTALLITLPINSTASVSPPRIKIEAKPRDKMSFNIEVKNKHDSPRSYKVSYSYYIQDQDGYQKEVKVESDSQTGPWNWIKLDSGQNFKIASKENLSINGILNIPSRNSLGFHNVLLTVTEFTPRKKAGVTLNYASGSLIELTVAGSKKRPKTALLNPVIKMNKESGVNIVHLDFDNQSPYKGRLFLEMHLRHNKRLIAKIPLLTEQSQKSEQPYSSIFPKNLVKLTGEIDKTLEPGDYEIRITGQFNGVRLRTFNQTLTIDESGQSVIEDNSDKPLSTLLKPQQ